jgi:hypothetical protein
VLWYVRANNVDVLNDSMARLTQNTPIAYRFYDFVIRINVAPPFAIGLQEEV